ncbi:MAG: transposase [Candidatus Methanomethylicaceae archaeon]
MNADADAVYVIDRFAIAVCDKVRLRRCKRHCEVKWRDYQASKWRYFYGLKIHPLVTANGQPVEFHFTPGSGSDTRALRGYASDLSQGAWSIGDEVYNDYTMEDILRDAQLYLLPYRKQNTRRPLPGWLCYLQSVWRKAVETTDSLLERLLPKSIHTVTARRFELKGMLWSSGGDLAQPDFQSRGNTLR